MNAFRVSNMYKCVLEEEGGIQRKTTSKKALTNSLFPSLNPQ